MYKLAAFDIDGTLLTSDHKVASSTHQALAELKEAGVEIVISSGRPYRGILKVVKDLDSQLVNYVSSFNGAAIYDLKTEEKVYSSGLTAEEVQDICQYGLELGIDVHTYNMDEILTLREPKDKYVQHEADIVGMPWKVEDFSQSKASIEKIMYTGDPAKLEAIIPKIPADYYDRYEIVRSAPYFLEFTAKGVNKGSGLAHLAEKLDIKADEVISFGDQENDLAMLEWAGMGVAMGNAVDLVKEKADYITATNDDDGIEKAVRKLILD